MEQNNSQNNSDTYSTDLSFEEAMRKIANTPKEDVERAIKEAEEKKEKREGETPEE